MGTFRQWFETTGEIHFSWSSYGEITVVINGRRYIYDVDAFWFPKLKFMLQKAGPWKTHNYIKNNFKLIGEPEVPVSTPAPAPKQLRLFR